MTKHVFILFAVFTGLAFSNCSNGPENPAESTTQDGLLKSFVLPDSIHKDLVVAMYAQTAPAGHVLLVYNNEHKTEARKITYFPDRKVSVERLLTVHYNELTAPDSKMDYVIRENTITVFYTGLSKASTSYNWSSESMSNGSTREYKLMALN